MQRDSGRNLAVAIMEGDALVIDVAHHQRDIFGREGMPQQPVAHAAAGGIGHLAVLQMETGIRKAIQIAGVVVVQMRYHHVADRFRPNAEFSQRIRRIDVEGATARFRRGGVEAGIDQNVAAVAAHQPDEVIEIGRRRLVRVGRQEIHGRRPLGHGRVADGVDFIGLRHGRRPAFLWLPTPSQLPPQKSNRSSLRNDRHMTALRPLR